MQAWIDGHGENAAGTKANINAGGAAKTAEAQTGDAEKNERHGDLCDDEQVAQSPQTARAGQDVLPFESG